MKAFALLTTIVTALAVVSTGCGRKVLIGKDEVRYSGIATEQEAKALGTALKTAGVFQDRGVTVLLSKDKNGAVVSYVLNDGLWDDFSYVVGIESVTRSVASTVGGLPLKVRLVNTNVQTKKEMIVHPVVSVGPKDEVYYSDPATEADAKALGKALKDDGYFQDLGASVLLTKGKEGAVISFVVQDGIWENPKHLAGFEQIGREIAPAMGGLPITVRLLNTSLQSQKVIPVKYESQPAG